MATSAFRRLFTFLVLASVAFGPTVLSRGATATAATIDPHTPIGNFPYSEGSGIVASRTYPGVFWVHRDSGNPAHLYAVKIVDGQIVDLTPGTTWKTVTTDASNSDWEDIGIDTSGRISIHEHGGGKIYRFGEVNPATAAATTRGSTLSWTWPGSSHDSESLFWWNDSAYIIDKRPCAPHYLYRRSTAATGTETLANLGEIVAPPVGWVEAGDCAPATGADVSSDGRRVAIVTERRVWIYEGSNPEDAVTRAPRWSVTHAADGAKEQVEAVSFAHTSYDLVTLSETGGRIRYIAAGVYSDPAPAPTTTTTAPATTTTTTAPTTTTTTAPVPAPAGVSTFAPVADARVAKGSPDRNYGTSSLLQGDNSPEIETFLRFDVQGISAPVTKARFRLYVTNQSSNGPEVYPTGATWSETAVTWNTRPARTGALVADTGSIASGRYVEWDVTKLVTGNGAYSLNVAPDSSDGADFKAREASANTPQLVVEVGSGPVADTTAPDTTITSGPQGTVTDGSATFAFTAGEPSTFGCALDGAAFAPCPSPVSYTGLAAGRHTFAVRATDTAGNVDATPASRSWTVDAAAPAPSAACGPDWGTATTIGVLGTNRGEMSGLVASSAYPGWGWGVRDSGNPATLYSIRPDGTTVLSSEFPVSGATNSDWEDVAYTRPAGGAGVLWILDNKGNSYTGNRVIYQVAEPDPTVGGTATVLGRYEVAYPDTQYNTEVLFAFGDRLAMISKTSASRVYLFDGPLQASVVNRPRYVGTLPEGSNLSVAAVSHDELTLAVSAHNGLRVYQNHGDPASLADLIADAPVFRQTMSTDNREGGDFFPYGSCNLVLVAESKNVWQLAHG